MWVSYIAGDILVLIILMRAKGSIKLSAYLFQKSLADHPSCLYAMSFKVKIKSRYKNWITFLTWCLSPTIPFLQSSWCLVNLIIKPKSNAI